MSDTPRRRPACALHANARAESTCRGCGLFLCGVCAGYVDPPRCGGCRGDARPVPWEDPKLGAPRAFVRTARALVRAPTFFAQLPWSGGLRAPLTFAATAATLGALVAAAFSFVSASATAAALAQYRQQLDAFPADMRRAAMPMLEGFERVVPLIPRLELSWALLQPVVVPLELLVMGALTHGVARALGGRGSFEATVRAMGYATGAQLLAAVPMVGTTVAPLLKLILTGVALQRAHGVSTGRAAVLAVWWIPVAGLLACALTGLLLSKLMPILLGR